MSSINLAKSAAQLREKLNVAKGNARSDMYLADVIPVSAGSAKLLIGYSPTFETPNHSQVMNFVNASVSRHMKVRDALTGALTVELGTLADHRISRVKAGVSVVVAATKITAKIEESANMVAVGGTMFMDTQFNANWEIKKDPATGSQHLECMRTENVPELLQTAIASQGLITGSRVKFSDPDIQATAALLVEVGDFVEFWADGGVRRGDVTSVEGDRVVIQADRPWSTNPSAVVKILRKNTKAVSEDKKQRLAHFSAIWGEEFARKFVNLENQL